MHTDVEIAAIDKEIRVLKASARRLLRMGEAIPAVRCNTARILTSLKMLELNICDGAEDEPAE